MIIKIKRLLEMSENLKINITKDDFLNYSQKSNENTEDPPSPSDITI